jgi:RNA polymerase sigma factor (sigma-70 family)
MNDSLHDLILRIGSGDPSAFEILFLMMFDRLCNKVLIRFSPTLSREDAEDAVQNAFILIKLHAHSYQGVHSEASAYTWINTIVSREASKLVEAHKRLPLSFDDLDETGGTQQASSAASESSAYAGTLFQDGNHSLEDAVSDSVLLDTIRARAPHWLSPKEIDILLLRFEHGYTFEQIGQVLGKTKPRAKQIVDALLERIRRFTGVSRPLRDGY